VSPLRLTSTANGIASPTIRRVLDEAIERAISADNRVRVVVVSVDGDEGYMSYFNECFAKLRVIIRPRGCDGGELMETVTCVCPFWINDSLHLLKNAQTRSFISQIWVNPRMQSSGASVTELRKCFEKSSTFIDARCIPVRSLYTRLSISSARGTRRKCFIHICFRHGTMGRGS
jgi:hypothetical protein